MPSSDSSKLSSWKKSFWLIIKNFISTGSGSFCCQRDEYFFQLFWGCILWRGRRRWGNDDDFDGDNEYESDKDNNCNDDNNNYNNNNNDDNDNDYINNKDNDFDDDNDDDFS